MKQLTRRIMEIIMLMSLVLAPLFFALKMWAQNVSMVYEFEEVGFLGVAVFSIALFGSITQLANGVRSLSSGDLILMFLFGAAWLTIIYGTWLIIDEMLDKRYWRNLQNQKNDLNW